MRRKATFEFTGCFDISSEIPHGVIAIDNFEHFHSVMEQNNTGQQSSPLLMKGCNRKDKRRSSQQSGLAYYQYYFLSHFHSDHFKGLHDKFFQHATTSEETCIVCHPITKTLLLSQFPNLDKDRILTIELHQPTLLPISHKFTNHTHDKENDPQNHLPSNNKVKDALSRSQVRNFTVTLLTSNHCVGSTMFLFEIQKGLHKEAILYTGDFRNVSTETTTFLKSQKLSKVYIDDTFCDETNFSDLPTRSQSIRNRRKEIDVMDALKEKVFTSNKDETFLRVVSKDTLKSLASLLLKEVDKPLFIQVSTMWLKYLNKETCGMAGKSEDITCKLTNDGIWKVLYSFHSSRNEMLHFLASISTNSTTIPSIISLNPQSKYIRGLVESLKQQMSKKQQVLIVNEDGYDYSFFETSAELFKEEFITFSHSSLTQKDNTFSSQSFNEDSQPRSQSSNNSDLSPISNSYTISSLETEPYSAIPDEVFDPEQLFSEISQGQDEEERTPITQSQSLSFLNSPFTPEASSTKKRAIHAHNTPSNGKDESFTMLNLSEDDNTPQKDSKKVKLK
ncbi:hypothetical protein C9374_004186 [Naegleria lovaniensis]|uniref:Protein artemis n=1 Tax=Naegleria lovaniensis TaxID=51637 RepID=A0AA88GN94_NAELO|nr:uncharacterized protein C9374_004186 [Naegleria lovaniensis]KAG2383515.1 hypothetical protein C9374_004186 [Naegleria lovaniensis]